MVSRDCKVDNFASSLFFIIIKSGLLAEIRWSVCMSKSYRSLCASFSRAGPGLCIDHLFVWSNLNFLHISQWISLPTQSCLVLYSFCTNLLHSLIMQLMVSSLSPHSLHLLFCCVLSILALISLVLRALSCAAIWRDSVIIVIIIIIILLIFEFFTPALSNSLLLESEWQQFSSSFQDSPQYSAHSQ